jgi:Fe-Mn family superoxide dismutase
MDKLIKQFSFFLLCTNLAMVYCNRYPFERIKLEYDYNALEPHIDSETMRIHYECHYKGYQDKLNEALKSSDELHKTLSIEDLLSSNSLPKSLKNKVRDFGGGLYNHGLYFSQFSHTPKKYPEGGLLKTINKQFSSVEKFKKKFNDEASKLFGSGWVWLIKKNNGQLKIIKTRNQDAPILLGKPLIGIDMWEHAYYLKHNCHKADYIESFWFVLDWAKIEDRFEKILSTQ